MESNESLMESILANKATPVLLMIIDIVFFFYLIPEPLAERFAILLGIVGGVITLILSFWTVASLTPELLEKYPTVVGLICISTLFVFGYYFIVKTSEFSSSQLNENGVLTEAEVVSKMRFFGRTGSGGHSMKVRFTTADDKPVIAKILLAQWEYAYFEKGMKIPIYYSSEHPTIVRIAHRKLKRKSPFD